MHSRILLLLVLTTGLFSCATYRNGMTPDDVYYSPETERTSYKEYRQEEDYSSAEELRIRQQIRDARLRDLEADNFRFQDYTVWNNRNLFINSWNQPLGFMVNPWQSWSQPFYCIPGTGVIIAKPGNPISRSTNQPYIPLLSTLSNSSKNTNSTINGNPKFSQPKSTNNGSRFFGGATNQSSGSWLNIFRPSTSSSYSEGKSNSGSRFFQSGRSSSGGTGTNTRTRRN